MRIAAIETLLAKAAVLFARVLPEIVKQPRRSGRAPLSARYPHISRGIIEVTSAIGSSSEIAAQTLGWQTLSRLISRRDSSARR